MTYDVADLIARADVMLPSPDEALQERLDQFSAFLYDANPRYRAEYHQFAKNLGTALAGDNAPGVGDCLPPFLLRNQNGELESLHSLTTRGPLIISFNRGAWCNYCQIELQELQKFYRTDIAERGRLVSISPDEQETGRLLCQHHGLSFSLLHDTFCSYALVCGLAVAVPQSLRELYLSRGYDISKLQGNDSWMIPIPATYVLSTHGVIRHRFLNRDFRTRQTLEQLRFAFEDTKSNY